MRSNRRQFVSYLGCGVLSGLASRALAQSAAARPIPIWSVAFSPDGKTLAAGSYQTVQLWDVETRAPGRKLTGHAGPVRCLTWTADGARLAAGGGKPGEVGEVKVWTVADGAAAATMTEHRDVVEGVAFSADGEVVVSAGVDEKALAVQIATRKVVKALTDHTNRVVTVAVSPDGKYVLTGALDRTVKVWSGADYTPLANLDNPGGAVQHLAFLTADQFLVAGEDGNTRVYRINVSRSGKTTGLNLALVRTLNGNRKRIFTVAASAKGNFLALGGEDKVVRVYDANGNRKHQLSECTDAVYAVALNPDGSIVAAGSRDGKVRLWGTADGKLIAEL
jgi:WD40 repeat protein